MSAVTFRVARREDLPAIVVLLADDDINGFRENSAEPLVAGYGKAFDAIARDDNNYLFVGEQDGEVIATAQVTFVPTLVAQGATRAIVEGVRVSSKLRSRGIGEKLLAFCEEVARKRGSTVLQLTTSMGRVHAHRFYERIGYEHTHKGFKRAL